MPTAGGSVGSWRFTTGTGNGPRTRGDTAARGRRGRQDGPVGPRFRAGPPGSDCAAYPAHGHGHAGVGATSYRPGGRLSMRMAAGAGGFLSEFSPGPPSPVGEAGGKRRGGRGPLMLVGHQGATPP